MKKLIIATTIGALLLAGCSTTAEKNAYYAAVESKNQAIAAQAKAKSDATMARMKVFEEAAKSSSGDTVKVAAMMAAAFTESGANGAGAQPQAASVEQAPGMNTGAWINAFLGLGNIAVQAYSINANKAISIGAQNAQVATAQSTNNMVTAITSAGFGANTTIATSGFGAMTTLGTTLGQPNVTLTGNGNAYASGGSATANYTTTTRTCTTGAAGNGAVGGNGGAGGGTTGAGGAGAPGGVGGVGGAATC